MTDDQFQQTLADLQKNDRTTSEVASLAATLFATLRAENSQMRQQLADMRRKMLDSQWQGAMSQGGHGY